MKVPLGSPSETFWHNRDSVNILNEQRSEWINLPGGLCFQKYKWNGAVDGSWENFEESANESLTSS